MALIRLALAGDARATDTSLCNCHWQLLDFDSLRGAPPRRGRLGERIATPVCALVRNDNLYRSAQPYIPIPTHFSHYTRKPTPKQGQILHKEFFHKGLEIGTINWYNACILRKRWMFGGLTCEKWEISAVSGPLSGLCLSRGPVDAVPKPYGCPGPAGNRNLRGALRLASHRPMPGAVRPCRPPRLEGRRK